MDRRRFLGISSQAIVGIPVGAAVGTSIAGAALTYRNDEPMHPAPVKPGQVLCDLHAHPTDKVPLDEIVKLLGSPGLIGLTARGESNGYLTYESAIRILTENELSFEEITPGQLATFQDGYFARTQEFAAGMHHLLAVGFEGSYFSGNGWDPFEAVKAVRGQGGVVILNHPYTVPDTLGFRLATQDEDTVIRELMSYVDEVEVHNATNINFLWKRMRVSNEFAAAVVAAHTEFKGTASSDCNILHEQAKICGIYVDEHTLKTEGMPGLKRMICEGSFERYGDPVEGPYLSTRSFTNGRVLPILKRGFTDV